LAEVHHAQVTLQNEPPEICDIEPPTTNPTGDVGEYDGTTGSPTTSLEVFRVIVYDPNGITDLPTTNIVAAGYVEHTPNTPYNYVDAAHTQRVFTGDDCSYVDDVDAQVYCGKDAGTNARRYKCNADMYYYDDPTPYTWDVYITSFEDSSFNDIETPFSEIDVFSLTEIDGFYTNQGTISFVSVPTVIGAGEGVSSQAPIIMINTANRNFNALTPGKTFDFTGRDLTRSGGTEVIFSSNFYSHLDDPSPATCDSASDKINLQDNAPVAFSSLILNNGDHAYQTTSGQDDAEKTVYFCIESINPGLPDGTYSTTFTGVVPPGEPWVINY